MGGASNPFKITQHNIERMIVWGSLLKNYTNADLELMVKLDEWNRNYKKYQKLDINQIELE